MDASGGGGQGSIHAAHQNSTEALMATVLGASPSLELSQQPYGDTSLNSLALEQQWQRCAADLPRGAPAGALAHPQHPQHGGDAPQRGARTLDMRRGGGMGSAHEHYARDEAVKALAAAHMQPARHCSPHNAFQVAHLSTAGLGGDLHHSAHDVALSGMDHAYGSEAGGAMGGLLTQHYAMPALDMQALQAPPPAEGAHLTRPGDGLAPPAYSFQHMMAAPEPLDPRGASDATAALLRAHTAAMTNAAMSSAALSMAATGDRGSGGCAGTRSPPLSRDVFFRTLDPTSAASKAKPSGNPAVQVSKQMYLEFKGYVNGGKGRGGEKTWSVGRLLQMACKRMASFMATQQQRTCVLDAFAAFRKSHRQKLSGTLLARSGIRLPADVLESLRDLLEVEDLDVWGMRRFLVEFLLSSCMGQVAYLPAWLQAASGDDPPERAASADAASDPEPSAGHTRSSSRLSSYPAMAGDVDPAPDVQDASAAAGAAGGDGPLLGTAPGGPVAPDWSAAQPAPDLTGAGDYPNVFSEDFTTLFGLPPVSAAPPSAGTAPAADAPPPRQPAQPPSDPSLAYDLQHTEPQHPSAAAAPDHTRTSPRLNALASDPSGGPSSAGGTAAAHSGSGGSAAHSPGPAQQAQQGRWAHPHGVEASEGRLAPEDSGSGGGRGSEKRARASSDGGAQGSDEATLRSRPRPRPSRGKPWLSEPSPHDGLGSSRNGATPSRDSFVADGASEGATAGRGDRSGAAERPTGARARSLDTCGPPSGSGRKPISVKGAAGVLMALGKLGAPAPTRRAGSRRARKPGSGAAGTARFGGAVRPLPTPETLSLERDSLFSALRMHMARSPRGDEDAHFASTDLFGKLPASVNALTQHVQRSLCVSEASNTSVVVGVHGRVTHLAMPLPKGGAAHLPTYGLVGGLREGAMLRALLACYSSAPTKRSPIDLPAEMRKRALRDLDTVEEICVQRLSCVESDIPLAPPDAADAAKLKALAYPLELRNYVTMFRLVDAWRSDPRALPQLELALGNTRAAGPADHPASPPPLPADAAADAAAAAGGASPGGGPAPGGASAHPMDPRKVELGQLLCAQVADRRREMDRMRDLTDTVQAVIGLLPQGGRSSLASEIANIATNVEQLQAQHKHLLDLRAQVVDTIGADAEDKPLDAVVSHLAATTEDLHDDVAYMLIGARTMMPKNVLKHIGL